MTTPTFAFGRARGADETENDFDARNELRRIRGCNPRPEHRGIRRSARGGRALVPDGRPRSASPSSLGRAATQQNGSECGFSCHRARTRTARVSNALDLGMRFPAPSTQEPAQRSIRTRPRSDRPSAECPLLLSWALRESDPGPGAAPPVGRPGPGRSQRERHTPALGRTPRPERHAPAPTVERHTPMSPTGRARNASLLLSSAFRELAGRARTRFSCHRPGPGFAPPQAFRFLSARPSSAARVSASAGSSGLSRRCARPIV